MALTVFGEFWIINWLLLFLIIGRYPVQIPWWRDMQVNGSWMNGLWSFFFSLQGLDTSCTSCFKQQCLRRVNKEVPSSMCSMTYPVVKIFFLCVHRINIYSLFCGYLLCDKLLSILSAKCVRCLHIEILHALVIRTKSNIFQLVLNCAVYFCWEENKTCTNSPLEDPICLLM